MTIYGWDASDFDWSRGSMDLAAARRAGIDFFTHKATEGTSVKHSHFGEAMRRARDAGVPVLGAYHVVRSPRNASAEVDYCLAYVNAATPWWRDFPAWFWQVDLEKWPYDAVPAAEGEQFADLIEARTGRKAVIYASKGQYGNELVGTDHELWNANYGTNPVADFRSAYTQRGGDKGAGWTSYSGRMPAIWQYGSRTRIGSQPTCDANAFRGTVDQLRALLGATKEDDMGDASDIVKAWSLGVDHTPDGGRVEPVRWRVRDETWQQATDGRFGALETKLTALETKLDALAVRPAVQLTDADRAAIAAQVLAALPADLANHLADALAQRLQS